MREAELVKFVLVWFFWGIQDYTCLDLRKFIDILEESKGSKWQSPHIYIRNRAYIAISQCKFHHSEEAYGPSRCWDFYRFLPVVFICKVAVESGKALLYWEGNHHQLQKDASMYDIPNHLKLLHSNVQPWKAESHLFL